MDEMKKKIEKTLESICGGINSVTPLLYWTGPKSDEGKRMNNTIIRKKERRVCE